MQQRVHIFYSGRVQGVGFRMTAEETAKSLEIAGWVKNLRDGRVEIVAEGEEAALKRFLEALQSGPMKNFIQRAEISWGNATEAFDGFEIRY